MSFNIDELSERFRSERESLEDNSKIVPVPMKYDHFRGIDEMRKVGEVLIIETEEDLHKWLSNAIDARHGKEKNYIEGMEMPRGLQFPLFIVKQRIMMPTLGN